MRVYALCLSLYVRIYECVSRELMMEEIRRGRRRSYNLTYVYMYVCPFPFLCVGFIHL